ncbi:hypothetical protein SDJN02_19164 [Cucurbita argyrosperma subsp. argyrosperma]|nr:hypothetical protein SDJN02_19164 [Cucurbita argyrosperma subsp. argyrosperma]
MCNGRTFYGHMVGLQYCSTTLYRYPVWKDYHKVKAILEVLVMKGSIKLHKLDAYALKQP